MLTYNWENIKRKFSYMKGMDIDHKFPRINIQVWFLNVYTRQIKMMSNHEHARSRRRESISKWHILITTNIQHIFIW